MVLSAIDTERERLSKRRSILAAQIESLPDGPLRDGMLGEQDTIEHRLGELWLERRVQAVKSLFP